MLRCDNLCIEFARLTLGFARIIFSEGCKQIGKQSRELLTKEGTQFEIILHHIEQIMSLNFNN